MTDTNTPHNLDAERSVIGACIRDNDRIPDVVPLLVPEDFYSFANQCVFRAMLELSQVLGRPADAVTILDFLEAQHQAKDVKPEYLVELFDAAPSRSNAVYYAQIVAEKSTARRLLETCHSIASDVTDNVAPAAELVDQAAEKIAAIAQRGFKEPMSIGRAVRLSLERIERKMADIDSGAVLTGLVELDNLTGGFQPGELVIIAARTSVGKSAFAVSSLLSLVTETNVASLLFSLEMAAIEIGDRALTWQTGINSWKLRLPKKLTEWEREALAKADDVFWNRPLFIADDWSQSVLRMAAMARRMKKKHNIGLIVADYLQLIQGRDDRAEKRYEQLAAITRQLKALAREVNLPVVVLCQLNREAEKTEKPKLWHLRESGSIEQDADTVLLLSAESADEKLICVNVAKQRNGPTGERFIAFDRATGRFSNATVQI
jgi:replicative DNA helicase